MARFGHRSLVSIVSVISLVGGMLLAAAPPSAAATCEVTNVRADITYATLQEAVDGAASGDTLEVRGTCIGKTIIRATRLRLKGVSTTEQPTPTLDGARLSRVLTVLSAKVVIRDLAITNGKAAYGGGISVHLARKSPDPARPRVTLAGDTRVTGNTAEVDGGGIVNYYGTITLNDSASVSENTAEDEGGGIGNYSGTITLNDSASVSENTAELGGGIINLEGTLILNGSSSVTGNTAAIGGGIANAFGTLTLNDTASVTGNTARMQGGGIHNDGGTLTLNDSSSVTGNTAGTEGGGIFIDAEYPGRVYVCSDEVAISPNDPDDPPKVRRTCP